MKLYLLLILDYHSLFFIISLVSNVSDYLFVARKVQFFVSLMVSPFLCFFALDILNISVADNDVFVVVAFLHIIVEDLTMYIDTPAIAACMTLESISVIPISSCTPIEGEYSLSL
jgi:hypothetical protein